MVVKHSPRGYGALDLGVVLDEIIFFIQSMSVLALAQKPPGFSANADKLNVVFLNFASKNRRSECEIFRFSLCYFFSKQTFADD